MKYLSFTLVFLVLAGCEQSAEELGVGTPGTVLVRSYYAPDARPATPEERAALHMANRAALQETGAVLRTSTSWQEADRRLRALIDAEPDPLRKRRLEETAATRMLQRDVLGLDQSPEALDATGDYVDLLVGHGSPNAPMVADALDKLEGHWSADRIERTAREARTALKAYATRQSTCEDCPQAATPEPVAEVAQGRQSAYDVEFARAESRIATRAGSD